jgi:hypothetical protein
VADNSPLNIPPGVDPTTWLQTQRQLQLAQALQGMALTPVQNDLQQPAGGGKYYVAARVRPTAALSKLAEALMASRGYDQAMPALAQQYGQAQQAFAPGGQTIPGQPLQAAAPPSDPNAQSVQPAIQRAPGASLAQTVQGAQPQTTPVNPMNPQGLPANVMMRLYMTDPAKYATMLQGTEQYQNALRAAGGDPNQAMALMRAQAVKAGAIDMRPGAMAMIPNGQGGYTQQRAPNLPAGYEPEFDSAGNYVNARLPSGILAGEAARTGVETGARNANTLETLPTQGGGTRVGWGGDVMGQPPALRAPPSNLPPQNPGSPQSGGSQGASPGAVPGAAPQPSGSQGPGGPRYFPPQPPTPGMPIAPPSGTGNPNDPWSTMPRMQIGQGLGAPGAYQEAIYKKAADKRSELIDQYGAASNLGDQRISYNLNAAGSLANADTGPLAEQLNSARGTLAQFGLLPQSQLDKLQDTTEANKYLINGALRNGKDLFGSRFTQSEVGLMLNHAAPGVGMYKPAIRELMLQDSLKAGYDKQKANDFEKYDNQGGDPAKFESWYSRSFPLQSFATANRDKYQGMLSQAESRGAAPKGAPPGTIVSDLPPAGQHVGRMIKDTQTGQILKSDGQNWVPATGGQ